MVGSDRGRPQLLRCYAIPTVPIAQRPRQTRLQRLPPRFLSKGEAVVVKIHSRDIVHKSEVNGVRLNLTSAAAVPRRRSDNHRRRAERLCPPARISGVTVQPMIIRPKARELIAGIADDPTFGPVIVFGRGGTAVEVINDKALSLPPLDLNLARDLIARTRVSRILGAYRNVPAAKHDEVALTLVKLAQLAADLPEVREPRHQSAARRRDRCPRARRAEWRSRRLRRSEPGSGHPRFAIRPYPSDWERHITIDGIGNILVRPVRPEDEACTRTSSARSRRTTCACASLHQSRISATPSSRD